VWARRAESLTLSELTASVSRLAVVGLAKNTGKTEALAALLRELEADGRRVGVTSVGRDGEERDVIDVRIEKPRVRLAADSLVATTGELLRSSGLPHDLLEQTDMRTPLGRVAIARLTRGGAIEVAGPSAAADVRAVSDAMLGHGAEQVLIDGAIDRRAASSPDVADALLMSTGAVLSDDIDEVVSRTRDAVELVRLPTVDDERLRRLAAKAADDGASLLLADDGASATLPTRFVLTADPDRIAGVLDANPSAQWLLVEGALPDAFLAGVAHALRRRSRTLGVLVADPTRVFLADRGAEWYGRSGVQLRALRAIDLKALTVNPLAPRSHTFDSARLRSLLADAIPGLPIFDVLDPDYLASATPAGARL
jgi:hypothetical protein